MRSRGGVPRRLESTNARGVLRLGVQPGVEPGAEGTVLDDSPNFTEFRGVKPAGRYYIVLFNGCDRPDIVNEAALEPV